ncbi:hypothetical protein ACB092_01G222100 [Castanea dentata]
MSFQVSRREALLIKILQAIRVQLDPVMCRKKEKEKKKRLLADK